MDYNQLLKQDLFQQSKNIVLFCNHTAFDFKRKKYLFDILIELHKLKVILAPEHGLFATQQDQVDISDSWYKGIPSVSIYNKGLGKLTADHSILKDSDAIIADIADVGVRYYTYIFHLFSLLEMASDSFFRGTFFIIDRTNPLGAKVEGTVIKEEYTSILGPSGLPHRHGMSTGQLCDWYILRKKLSVKVVKIKTKDTYPSYFIPPSPNLPSLSSLIVYPGQCFWEATSLSEGRGTTRPFELFGHPEISLTMCQKIANHFNRRFNKLALLRPTEFIPVYHKHTNVLCQGWQLFVENTHHYHTVFGTLYIMYLLRNENVIKEFWLSGPYEYGSDHTAAELLIGDDDLIAYVNEEVPEKEIEEKFFSNQLYFSKIS
ncbi:MAG: DUF1343 domain-containing protein [Saprospiraceae bacterium]|nr:DUF1343 domain-containing protein [Saprospiraceae bacterium]